MGRVDLAMFERQMKYLADQRMSVVHHAHLSDWLHGEYRSCRTKCRADARDAARVSQQLNFHLP